MAAQKPETTIEQTELIPDAKPVEVYDAYVNPKKHAEFTGATATGDTRVGGEFSSWHGYIFGRYMVLETGKRVVQEWQTTEWPADAPPSRLELKFERDPAGTRMTLTHTEVPSAQAERYEQGWREYYWTPLKQYFARKYPRKG
jgi:activator of HSP90 ATPase